MSPSLLYAPKMPTTGRRGNASAVSPASTTARLRDAPGARRALLDWYADHARDLPWRRTRDPYRIWVSEVMLQQTRVDTVLRYYDPFLARFPDLETLARAPLADVLKAWEGLGYYRRARNLHAAAGEALRAHGGVPSDPGALRALTGVGAYTAAAVGAIAFDQPHLPLDGNIRRVLSRLLDLDSLRDADYQRARGGLMEGLGPGEAGQLVQALMELGALVCLPRRPACTDCPLGRRCLARRRGTITLRPPATRRPPVPQHGVVIAYLRNRAGRILLVRRPEEGFLGGLWELPGGKVKKGESLEAAVRRELIEEVGIDRVERLRYVGAVRHAYSHFKVTLQLFEGRTRQAGALREGPVAMRWVAPGRLGDYALPRGTHKALALLERPPRS